MTEFSAHQLCWFGLGWAAELPGFSHGTNVPCAYAGPGMWELLPQPDIFSLWLCHDRGLGLVPKLALPLFLSILREYHAKMGS